MQGWWYNSMPISSLMARKNNITWLEYSVGMLTPAAQALPLKVARAGMRHLALGNTQQDISLCRLHRQLNMRWRSRHKGFRVKFLCPSPIKFNICYCREFRLFRRLK